MRWSSSHDGTCYSDISPADRDTGSSQCNKRAYSIAHLGGYSKGGNAHYGSRGDRYAN